MKLTKTRQNWADSRNATIVGKPLAYPASVASDYDAKLSALVTRMRKEYERETRTLYRDFGFTMDASIASQARIIMNRLGERWAKIFTRAANDIVEGFVTRVDKFAKSNLESSLKELSGGLTIKTPKMPGDMSDRIKASIAENVALIKTIPDQYHKNIEGVVMRSIQSGQEGSATIFKEIQKQGVVTDNRAELIAIDQTRKLTSSINIERMQAAGITRWRWVHSGGGKEPRPLHVELDGQEFSYEDDPPIIDDRTGERGFPGQLINCRCRLVPIISFAEEDD